MFMNDASNDEEEEPSFFPKEEREGDAEAGGGRGGHALEGGGGAPEGKGGWNDVLEPVLCVPSAALLSPVVDVAAGKHTLRIRCVYASHTLRIRCAHVVAHC
jgi:hypothetical protein